MTNHTRPRTSLVLAALFACTAAAVPAAAASRAHACRAACHTLVRHACHTFFGTRAPCRARILRRCRADGPALCDAARTCDRSCRPLEAECRQVSTSFLCGEFPFHRCLDLGPAYCDDPATVHGCNRVFAEDHRREALVTVTFTTDGIAYDYAPECILVAPGTTVRFEGPFADEPLIGGTVPTPDPSSPFSPTTVSGTSRDVVFASPGTYPYFGGDFSSPVAPGFAGLPWGAVIVDGGA
jgi:plastocyanin